MTLNNNKVLDEAYKTAMEAAIEAGKHILTYWPNPLNGAFNKDLVLEIFEKNEGIGNYATIADTTSENIILSKIKSNPLLSDHSILAEESEETKGDSPYQWVIDPIDGTLNFRNGLSGFGISIGILHKHKPVIGIIAMPALNHILVARTGEGTKLLSFDQKHLLDVTKITYNEPLTKALISYDTGYENRSGQLQDTAEKIADKVGYPVSYSGSSLSNYNIALGHVAAYIHKTPTKYDVAAAEVIIKEIGGVVTDMKGNPIDWSKPNISYIGARNSKIHRQLLELLSQ